MVNFYDRLFESEYQELTQSDYSGSGLEFHDGQKSAKVKRHILAGNPYRIRRENGRIILTLEEPNG